MSEPQSVASALIFPRQNSHRIYDYPVPPRFSSIAIIFALLTSIPAFAATGSGNRHVFLHESDPFHARLSHPKLTTPQWVGESGVEAVVILSIDDMRDPARYETFLRPILARLKKIDGRAPVSIFCNAIAPTNTQIHSWLKEGLSMENHTLAHPCPLLQKGSFTNALDTYHGGVDLLNQLPVGRPVAFRMPCCDSMNSPSPRFYSEIFNSTSRAGKFLSIDSSIMCLLTANDAILPRELVLDKDGRDRFRKYLPIATNTIVKRSMELFGTTIEDYPYPYVINRLCWEFPPIAPSDWEANNLHSPNNPTTLADWKAAMDAIVIKQGIFPWIFHPHGWIKAEQIVEFINHTVTQHGNRVKFLTFAEAQQRIDQHLLAGQPLRNPINGGDNGVRLLDLNDDGQMDIIIANEKLRRTRIWDPAQRKWNDTTFPVTLAGSKESPHAMNSLIGILNRQTILITRSGAWRFIENKWVEDNNLALPNVGGRPVALNSAFDAGARLRDIDNDGQCELIVSNPQQNGIYAWNKSVSQWVASPFKIPADISLVDDQGRDNGLRFIDINSDGYDDLIFSNDKAWSIHLWNKVLQLGWGWNLGWSHLVRSGKRGEPNSIPPFVRSGPHRDNGAWFHSNRLFVQNEDTAHLNANVEYRTFKELIAFPAPPPKSPQDSLDAIRVPEGFAVQLVAHEPLVLDPIAFDWGADGRLWVVEMGDYPKGVDGKGKPGGQIRILEDTNGDGRYDKYTLFLDGLNFPTGVMPWRKGAIISAAPEIFYAEDTDGDGKADLRKTLFTGFSEGNQQHRVNGFQYGLDNWIYGANGDSGGTITSIANGSNTVINGHDFRFRPDTGQFQRQSGQTQFGRYRDDWGNWFGNNNPNWLWHYFLPEHYLARNTHLLTRSNKQMLGEYTDSRRVFPISPSIQRFNTPQSVNYLTSANSPSPYRDSLFGAAFENSIFISEPVHNLVHREVLTPTGLTFTSHRADKENGREFLASADNWFRPTMIKTGPDGALYIADMYRFVIEHPEWISPEMQQRLDLRAGHDMGRIYRVHPKSIPLRPIPRLDTLDTPALVAAIESPNGWQRDTVQRLLFERADPSARKPLAAIIANSKDPKVRLQALCSLDGIGAIDPVVLRGALNDTNPIIRAHAIRLCENGPLELALPRANDADVRVRYQLAFSMGEWKNPQAATVLVEIAIRDADNPFIQQAVLSSAVPHAAPMLRELCRHGAAQAPAAFITHLLDLTLEQGDHNALLQVLHDAFQKPDEQERFKLLSGLLDVLHKNDAAYNRIQAKASAELRLALSQIDGHIARARTQAEDSRVPLAVRIEAAQLLGREPAKSSFDAKLLAVLLQAQHPDGLQRAALQAVRNLRSAAAGTVLAGGWRKYSPAIRTELLATLIGRTEWIPATLGAIEQGTIGVGEIALPARQQILANPDAAIRSRAEKLFARVNADRAKVIQQFAAVPRLTGDPQLGAALYKQHCAVCHRFRAEGKEVGPDLGAAATKPIEELIVAIFDPNRALEQRYISYTVVLKNNNELAGVITTETETSVTVRTALGTEETLLRKDIQSITGGGLSLMPEGLEAALMPKDLADLLAFLKSNPKK